MEVIMNIFKVSKSLSNVKHVRSGLIAATLATLIATSPLANANNEHEQCQHKHWWHESRSEHFQKRQQELHDKLSLTASQEAAWSVFVAKTKPSGMHDNANRSEVSNLSTPERMDRMLAKAKEREQQFEVRVQATKDLYKQLTPTQQKIFDTTVQHHEDERHQHEQR